MFAIQKLRAVYKTYLPFEMTSCKFSNPPVIERYRMQNMVAGRSKKTWKIPEGP